MTLKNVALFIVPLSLLALFHMPVTLPAAVTEGQSGRTEVPSDTILELDLEEVIIITRVPGDTGISASLTGAFIW